MNAQAPIEPVETSMTSSGEVLVPKMLRDLAGLVPGGTVRVGLNDRGEVVVLPNHRQETTEEKRARIRAAIASVRGTLDTGFATTDEYMDFIRPHRHDLL